MKHMWKYMLRLSATSTLLAVSHFPARGGDAHDYMDRLYPWDKAVLLPDVRY
jgi:hypothetical protein